MDGLHDLHDRPGDAARGHCSSWAARTTGEHPGELRAPGRARAARRPRDPGLHLRHHRPAQGRDASHRNILFQLGYADFITRLAARATSSSPSCPSATSRSGPAPYSTRSTPAPRVNFAESLDTVPEDIREIAPARVLRGAADLGEVLLRRWRCACARPPRPGRVAYALGASRSAQAHRRAAHRGPAGAVAPEARLPAARDFLVLDNVKRSIGLHRARGAATGAAPIAPELIRWYLALGINMLEVYGQTENTGARHRRCRPTASSWARSGLARPDTEVRLSPEGEILLRGPPRLPGLLPQAGEDGGDGGGRVAAHRRRRHASTRTASCRSPTA